MQKESAHIIVKPPHPLRRRLIAILLVLLMVFGSWSLFEYGRSRAGFDSTAATIEYEKLHTQMQTMEVGNATLRNQNITLMQAREIDRHAYDEIEVSLKDLQSELLELKEEVTFYRSIVGSAGAIQGLQIQNLKLKANDVQRSFKYRVILTQYVKNNRFVRGFVKLTVFGVQNGAQMQLEHADLANKNGQGAKFRFKYFQEVIGDITLPEGFVPLKVLLHAVPEGGKYQPIEKSFSWTL